MFNFIGRAIGRGLLLPWFLFMWSFASCPVIGGLYWYDDAHVLQKLLFAILAFFYCAVQLHEIQTFFYGSNKEMRYSNAFEVKVFYEVVPGPGLLKALIYYVVNILLFSLLADLIHWSRPFGTFTLIFSETHLPSAIRLFKWFSMEHSFISGPLFINLVLGFFALQHLHQ